MPLVHRDGLKVHYLDTGRGATVVMLLHAFPLSGEMFRPQLQELGGKYRFLIPDLRGFGQSDVGPGPTRMEALAEDALAILDAAKVKTAVVGGVSMGGYVSMALLRLDAGRVKALVLADTQAQADDDARRAQREVTAQAVLDKGMGVLADELGPRLLSPDPPPAVLAEVRRLILEGNPHAAAAASRGLGLRADSREVLSRFSGPALVVHGDSDALTPTERHVQMAELVRGARVVAIPKAGHLANLEAPAEFNRTLDEFLSALR